jgi:alkylation response protein AidB-like acyl-CoA dehydrogenase
MELKLKLSAEDEAFRREVRAFVEENLPAGIRRRVETGERLRREDFVTWQRILHARGWIAPHWPAAYGGSDMSPMRRFILNEELAAAPTPRIVPFGLAMVAPVIMAFGSDEQKAKYLPRILASDDWWCQGYSEPGSGSDLASLKTRAVRDGDHYVVSGQKTWTTYAQYADMMFCLVRTRTDGKPQEGISFLLIDMKSPGITVRPITTIDGGREINDVFFDDVRVPAANLVGKENEGWTCAKFLLGHERTTTAEVGRSRRWLRVVEDMARSERDGGQPLIDDPEFRSKLVAVDLDLAALEALVLRVLGEQDQGQAPGAEASILKTRGTEIQQALTQLMFEAVGPYALPHIPEALEDGWNEEPVGPGHAAPAAPLYFNWRKASIYGGSTEIQKNIIAKLVLGL